MAITNLQDRVVTTINQMCNWAQSVRENLQIAQDLVNAYGQLGAGTVLAARPMPPLVAAAPFRR